MSNIRPALLSVLVLASLVVACAGASPSSDPSSSAAPSNGLQLPITTPEAAMAAIVAVEPRFAGIGPVNPDLVGQAAWYDAKPASGVGAFVVTIQVGWGDCPAGCIERHTWTYAVAPDGTVKLLSEVGDPVPPDAFPKAGAGGTGIVGHATAGPVCPVERPGDPACLPRPVANATIVVSDASGAEVGTMSTLPDGSFAFDVPPGAYVVQGRSVDGLMGTPEPMPVSVQAGTLTTIELAYDTGIR
jgi:hypothetical protein